MKKAFETKFLLFRKIGNEEAKKINLGFTTNLKNINFKTIPNLEKAYEYL